YDKAIADFSEAIRLDPKDALAYHRRGLVWYEKKEYSKSITDYSEAIRLDPKNALAYYNRGVSYWLELRDGDVVSEMKNVLQQGGWRGDWAAYAAILGHLAARRSGKLDEAGKFLDDFKTGGDMIAWPSPVVRHLRGEIDDKALLAASTDDDARTG